MNELADQPLPPWRRAVLKVGSSLLAADGGGLTPRFAAALAAFIASSHDAGRQVVLVSSGAVAAGRALLHARAAPGCDLAARQALAALGQAPMIALWQSLSARPVAQVLLTHDDLRNRRRYLNARATLHGLVALGALPVVNENDTVAVDELKLGDNDNLAAIVAALIGADLLLIASDVDALYNADPRRDPAATPIARVEAISAAVMALAGGSGSAVGTGGMRTKLEAAEKALHVPAANGRIRIDGGAARALGRGRASLLPGGVVAVDGEFQRGDLVEIVDIDERRIARGLSQYTAAEVRRLAGRHSREIESLLGYSHGAEVVHRDDLASLPEQLLPGAA